MVTSNHVLVTPPDRYWSQAFVLLLVDVDYGMMEQIIEPLRASPVPLAIHLYQPNDDDPAWLFDVANSANMVIMDLNQITNNSLLKGHLISKTNVWYIGRPDLEQFWPRYTADPLATVMLQLEYRINLEGTT